MRRGISSSEICSLISVISEDALEKLSEPKRRLIRFLKEITGGEDK